MGIIVKRRIKQNRFNDQSLNAVPEIYFIFDLLLREALLLTALGHIVPPLEFRRAKNILVSRN